MKFDDQGNASFFAVIDKSLASQRERIQNKREQKAEDRKEAEQKAAREKQEKLPDWQSRPEDMVTVEASSWDELLQKINETITKGRSDLVQTPSEAIFLQFLIVFLSFFA